MKKIVVSIALLMSMWMSTSVSFAGGEMMMEDSYNPYYEPQLRLESLLNATKDRTIKKIFEDNFEMIAQNTVYENYEYNSLHFENKQVSYSLFIPQKLQSKVRNITVEIKNSFVDYLVPFEDAKIMNNDIPVELEINVSEYEWETISGNIDISKDMFWELAEFWNSFTLQAYITLSDRTIVPYSQLGYIYVYGNWIEWIKTSLSNAYYNSQINIWYPDIQRLLQTAFSKLEQESASTEIYLSTLAKIEEKANIMIENYTQIWDTIAENVTNEETFQDNIEMYWKNMMKINTLNDALWQIRTEIETRKSVDIIDELFSDYQ